MTLFFAVFFWIFTATVLALGVQWVLDQFRDSHRVIDEAPFPALPQTTESSNVVVLPRQGVQR